MPKLIQIVSADVLYGLADDGSVWWYNSANNGWEKFSDSLPETEPK